MDAGWWVELDLPTTSVATDATGAVLGVVSYALRPKDAHGVILWLHCRENETVARALLDHAATDMGPRSLDAFHFTSALTLGLEALPVRHRPATHAALTAAGYRGTNLWRYMHRALPAPELPRLTHYETEAATPDTRRLLVTEDGETLADATIGTPVQGTVVLWWIGVEPAARGRGLGRALLGTALDALHRGDPVRGRRRAPWRRPGPDRRQISLRVVRIRRDRPSALIHEIAKTAILGRP
ncbi:GNAT family N-acetyltransferase [Streptomyces sp. NPDC059680]|uniref:GNAT family N-acetyltransferase n=1 Tax=Streptomyces sp. NPDC059680 TaxID=3346904 RepID=UPI00369B05AE